MIRASRLACPNTFAKPVPSTMNPQTGSAETWSRLGTWPQVESGRARACRETPERVGKTAAGNLLRRLGFSCAARRARTLNQIGQAASSASAVALSSECVARFAREPRSSQHDSEACGAEAPRYISKHSRAAICPLSATQDALARWHHPHSDGAKRTHRTASAADPAAACPPGALPRSPRAECQPAGLDRAGSSGAPNKRQVDGRRSRRRAGVKA
jgi:hypothetical protein